MSSRSATASISRAEPIGAATGAARRNQVLGISSGALANLAGAFLSPELIVVGMIYALTRSAFLVALVPIVVKIGMLAPQLWAGSRMEHLPRKMPYYTRMIQVRAAGFVAMVLAIWLLTRGVNVASLALLYASLLVINACGGAGHVLQMDVIGRMIPARRLGSFLGARSLWGTLSAAVAGLVIVQPVLVKLSTPWNYMLLGTVGGMLAIASMIVFTRCREADGPSARRKATLAESFRRGFGWLRTDRNYRAFFIYRIAFRMSFLSLIFFIPYGSEKLAIERPEGLAILGGLLIAVKQVSQVITSAIWGRMADRRGFRVCLIGSAGMFTLAAVLALLAPALPGTFTVTIPGMAMPLDLPLTVLLLAMPLIGAAVQGAIIGDNHFIVSSAPPKRRPSYLGFVNTVTSPLSMMSLVAAAMARALGFSAVYWLVIVGGVLGLLAAATMKGPPRAEGKLEGMTANAQP